MVEEFNSPAELPPEAAKPSRGIAPLWHTALLVAAIVSLSALGTRSVPTTVITPANNTHRVVHYAMSAALELLLVAWVWFGLRLKKIPFRSMLGSLPRSLNDITRDFGIAVLFWVASMIVLSSVALTWSLAQTAIYDRHHHEQTLKGNATVDKEKSPQEQQVEMARKLMQLAPQGNLEIWGWATLCLVVGFSEELVFRGYLQQQGISLFHRITIGALFSAFIFGAAHGYQGIRGMVLIGLFGGLFSVITLVRKTLIPGMLAHSWHDFATGMMLALIRDMHLLDKLDTLGKFPLKH
jgi:membrane protease YdiL (CAAX protease family)